MSGESDYLLKVAVRADDSYERVHREILSALPGVHRLVTQFTHPHAGGRQLGPLRVGKRNAMGCAPHLRGSRKGHHDHIAISAARVPAPVTVTPSGEAETAESGAAHQHSREQGS